MKSIKNTLAEVKKILDRFSEAKGVKGAASIIGGNAVILHGVERTTIDIDICYFAERPSGEVVDSQELFHFVEQKYADQFECEYFRASADREDPLKHDILFLVDKEEKLRKIDILFARYKWEAEGLEKAFPIKGLSLPLFPKPHLVAMKLKAGGRKDELDIVEMLKTMDREELEQAKDLSIRIHKNTLFNRLFSESEKKTPIGKSDEEESELI